MHSFGAYRIPLLTAILLILSGAPAWANHPVLVEGEADFDGDGEVGLAEDADGDRIFGTITAALEDLGQNGKAIFVTSGRFAEVVSITGQVTLEAAPGVDVDIEAFLAPSDPRLDEFPAAQAAPFALQAAPGIVVDAPANRRVEIRNLEVVNWTDGILVRGDSHVVLDDVRVQHNVNHGVRVLDDARVAIRDSSITSTGFRLNPVTGDFPSEESRPGPGDGVSFGGRSRGSIRGSLVAGNFGAGVAKAPGAKVSIVDTQRFDNRRSAD